MGVFVPVITNFTAHERDRDRLLSLGTLAAGLAHELNNPAAAAQRSAAELRVAERDAQSTLSRLATSGLDADGMARRCTLTAEALGAAERGTRLAGLDRADREAELATWLEDHGVTDRASAVALVDAGLDETWAESLLAVAPGEPDSVVGWVASRLVAAVSREPEDATARTLVNRSGNTHFDHQAPRQKVDVTTASSTLAILAHRISQSRAEIVRVPFARCRASGECARAEPGLDNLIDNAVAAARENGRVTIELALGRFQRRGRGRRRGFLRDRRRVFDAFFTTRSRARALVWASHRPDRRAASRDLRLKQVDSGAASRLAAAG
jgi:signal transduction histidine kinase